MTAAADRDPFSRRLEWDARTNALARLTEEKQRAGVDVFDLTISNPTAAGIPYPETLLAPLADRRGLAYRPDPQGPPCARQAIARAYEEQGLAVDSERLVLTASTSEAYSWLFKLLCMPGDEVAVPKPSYPLFDFLAHLECVGLRPYALGFDGQYHWDASELERALAVDPLRLRSILLVNPNNPTGNYLHRQEREAIVQLAHERGLPLIVDEVFSHYALEAGADAVRSMVDERRALTFCLNGFSKLLGLPQLKLGWIYVAGPEEAAARALANLTLIADTYLSVSTPVALATPELLGLRAALAGAIGARLEGNLASLRQTLGRSAATVLPVEGGWYATLALPRICSDEEWALTLLEEDNLIVQPGYFFDDPIEAHVVICLLTPPRVLAEGLRRIAQRLSRLAPLV